MPNDRYRNTPISKDKNRLVRKYTTTLPPTIERNITDIYIVARPGDRLDLYAQRYYGDPSMWWIIAQANHLGKGSLAVPTGRQIRIPQNTDEIIALARQQNEGR